ncbi:MAG: MBL fold metallo-hydrolase [Candidatus Altiarchaeota archaeon]|nr:MBL fold metallo-hydrolase [Candidatus Altiarchaeota archaeon]
MKLSVLVEDTAPSGSGLGCEHGFSALVEADGKRILFDTGQSCMFLENAEKMGVEIENLDFVVLSHGHYDHTGGLPSLSRSIDLTSATLLAHPLAFEGKFYPGGKDIGCPMLLEYLTPLFGGVLMTKEPYPISKNIYFTGEVPRLYEKPEEVGRHYESGVIRPDFMPDDSSLVFRIGKRLVVVSGCAHAGILNISKYAESLFEGKIHALIGGFHLLNAGQERLETIISEFGRMRVEEIYPGHCTGEHAIEEMGKKLSVTRIRSGTILEV